MIAEIHGNLAALEAALEAIGSAQIDAICCGGDLVGYGPHPNEVCRLIEERRIPTIHANHDYAIGRDLDVLVFGHAHGPWVHEHGVVPFIHCGSVGKPKDGDPRAAFAILDSSNGAIDATIQRVEYDVEPVAREVAAVRLPGEYAEKLLIAA